MKKEEQLTAVEWLVNQLETGFNYNILEEDGYKKQRKIIFKEALELEHAQHQLLKMKSKSKPKMKANLINTWKEWGVIVFTPMVAIDFEEKSFKMAWLVIQFELNKSE